MVLRGIFLGSREEIAAYCRGLSLPLRTEHDETLAIAAAAILGQDPREASGMARRWLDHERVLMGEACLPMAPDARQMAKARIQMHYLIQDCFLTPGTLLAGIGVLRTIHAALVQGLADPVCPPATADRLRQAWPEAAWLPVAGGGHSGMSPAIASACMAALARIASAA